MTWHSTKEAATQIRNNCDEDFINIIASLGINGQAPALPEAIRRSGLVKTSPQTRSNIDFRLPSNQTDKHDIHSYASNIISINQPRMNKLVWQPHPYLSTRRPPYPHPLATASNYNSYVFLTERQSNYIFLEKHSIRMKFWGSIKHGLFFIVEWPVRLRGCNYLPMP